MIIYVEGTTSVISYTFFWIEKPMLFYSIERGSGNYRFSAFLHLYIYPYVHMGMD